MSARRWPSWRPRSISTSGCSTTASATPAASAFRRPSACSSATSAPPCKQLAPTTSTPSVYCLIVTRGHGHDEEALYHLAPTRGRLRRHDRQQAQDQADLRGSAAPAALPAEALERVHAPLGFAIGSQTVPEIAISIVAELIACRNLGATIPDYRRRPLAPREARPARRMTPYLAEKCLMATEWCRAEMRTDVKAAVLYRLVEKQACSPISRSGAGTPRVRTPEFPR